MEDLATQVEVELNGPEVAEVGILVVVVEQAKATHS
jgi:hypothetical protein